ncbi:hypothetical protein [Salinisphaera japonica]|uniref:Uncharacterized protein n=1 Tax=Salinisphaera japonica YTM-1 TaxID=1209778 RepID=A0A423PM32_9GAMM|nr:hypothetical protein [Salinisphaera japonica]ROO26639.1 hypothetical protein SAJA_10865 [Salinisphaera japonica YTM-1]
MLLNLLTAGAACALGAFLIALRIGEPGRVQRAGALFVAMLSLMLAVIFPGAELFFGFVGIVAAIAYAIPAVRSIRSTSEDE